MESLVQSLWQKSEREVDGNTREPLGRAHSASEVAL